mgnify:CR=1 FL=1
MINQVFLVAGLLCMTALTGCTNPRMAASPMSDAQKTTSRMLFSDPMTGDWREHWFLDGKKATLENRDGGLLFTATPSNVDKNVDRTTFDAHHAILWTKQEFEGDIRYQLRLHQGLQGLHVSAVHACPGDRNAAPMWPILPNGGHYARQRKCNSTSST